jgi:hypothetical protein
MTRRPKVTVYPVSEDEAARIFGWAVALDDRPMAGLPRDATAAEQVKLAKKFTKALLGQGEDE